MSDQIKKSESDTELVFKNENQKILVDCHVFDETFQGTTSYLKGLYSELIQDKSKTYYLVANHPDKLEKYSTNTKMFLSEIQIQK